VVFRPYLFVRTNDFIDKEGPIHDVHWSPNSREFGVVYGYMPAKTTIFNQRAKAVHNFNLGPRNTILFSPHGRFVIVAGFGNLAGEMDIYDLEKNFLKITTIKASNPTFCEWSPDGKHILAATTSPRLRVENGVRIWHVLGGIMYSEDMNELYQVAWRPQSITQHPLENPLDPAPAPHSSALKYLETAKTPSKPVGAYRPPGARGTATPLAFKREDEGGAAYIRDGISSTSGGVVNGFGRPKRQVPGAETVEETLPPGAAPGGGVSLAGAGDENLSKAALKNKKKREAKKAKEAEAQGAGLAAPAATNGHAAEPRNPEKRDHARSRSRNGIETPPGQSRRRDTNRQNAGPPPQLSTPVPAAMEAPGLTVTSPDVGSPQDKKIRALHKKLRAIDDLKMRQAGGEKLEATQISKITTEESVRKELSALGFTE